MEQIIETITCPHCGHISRHMLNVYGKTCSQCEEKIEPADKPAFVKEAEDRKVLLQDEARKQFLKSLTRRKDCGDKTQNRKS